MSLSGDAANARGEKKGLFKSIFQGSRQERDKLQRDDREKLPNAGQQLPQQPQPQPQPQTRVSHQRQRLDEGLQIEPECTWVLLRSWLMRVARYVGGSGPAGRVVVD